MFQTRTYLFLPLKDERDVRGRIAHATTELDDTLVPPRGPWRGIRLVVVVVVVVVVVDGRTDGRTDGERTDGRTDGRKDGCV